EQTPAMLQLFYQYFKTAQTKEEGEFLTPVEILNFLKKKSGISLSDNKVYHFGRLLQKCGIPSKHTYKGTVYQVIKVL
ncbi:helicase, partial [Escherichia coli]|nr:helicase [Escherichia coli]